MLLKHSITDVSPYCDKCQINEASLIHMYCSCPRLSMYWTEIFQTLSQVFSIELDPNPLAALSGVIGKEMRLTADGGDLCLLLSS